MKFSGLLQLLGILCHVMALAVVDFAFYILVFHYILYTPSVDLQEMENLIQLALSMTLSID